MKDFRSIWQLSWRGMIAMLVKETIQMRRDRMTFVMIFGMPIMQLLLFGFAINTDPKDLPTAIVAADNGPITRTIITALQNTGYFEITDFVASPDQASDLLKRGDVQFAIMIPPDFERRYIRGERPQILIEADASDPAATANALAAGSQIDRFVLGEIVQGTEATKMMQPGGFDIVVHRLYNPENKTRYNIVPGLIGVILMMTMTIITCIAITRERERGTLETLLVLPFSPLDVMVGKILPYVLVGYVQMAIILAAAAYVFGVPIKGSIILLSVLTIMFIAANLALGFLLSTVATTQLEAVQMSFLIFLPSILLSGFMFPFRGMPEWAQWIGTVLPMTHYLRIVRGIILKGSGFFDLMGSIVPLLLIFLVISIAALVRYRQTLD